MSETPTKPKRKRVVLGSLIQASAEDKKKGLPNYIKVRESVTLNAGESIRAESKKFQLESLDKAVADGKVDGEYAEKIKERINKIPDWVIAELVVLR